MGKTTFTDPKVAAHPINKQREQNYVGYVPILIYFTFETIFCFRVEDRNGHVTMLNMTPSFEPTEADGILMKEGNDMLMKYMDAAMSAPSR